jgi:hypothetical protein
MTATATASSCAQLCACGHSQAHHGSHGCLAAWPTAESVCPCARFTPAIEPADDARGGE